MLTIADFLHINGFVAVTPLHDYAYHAVAAWLVIWICEVMASSAV